MPDTESNDPAEPQMQDTLESLSMQFRRTVGHFATGIAVLTSIEGDEPVGMTVQSFTSVSLDPLLVSLAVARNSGSWSRIRSTGQVCINILASDQTKLSQRFAQPVANRFDGIAWRRTESGLPILDDVLAWIDCSIGTTHVAGDHEVALCSVRDLAIVRATEPLLYFRGSYSSISTWGSVGHDTLGGLPAPW